MTVTTTTHDLVSTEKWIEARKALLLKEKELTQLNDQLSQQRRELPWVQVEKNYVFDGPDGKRSLADLFGRRSQLIVYHFMFGPGWKEGCPGCSFLSDHVDGARQHFEHNDLSFAAISRAPWSEIEPFQKRMGWRFQWLSSHENDFNYDFHVSFKPGEIATGNATYNYELRDIPSAELPGASVFYKDPDGSIFHTYSTYGRGLDMFLGAYRFLDIAPKGRNETGPRHDMSGWMRHHDKYEDDVLVDLAVSKSECGCGEAHA